MEKPPAYSPYPAQPAQAPQPGFHVPQNPYPGNPQYPQQQQYPVYAQPAIQVNMSPPPTHTQTVVVTPGVIQTGNCPGCRRGMLNLDFTCCGVLCAILFFPLGILCCFMMAERRCSSCRGVF